MTRLLFGISSTALNTHFPPFSWQINKKQTIQKWRAPIFIFCSGYDLTVLLHLLLLRMQGCLHRHNNQNYKTCGSSTGLDGISCDNIVDKKPGCLPMDIQTAQNVHLVALNQLPLFHGPCAFLTLSLADITSLPGTIRP